MNNFARAAILPLCALLFVACSDDATTQQDPIIEAPANPGNDGVYGFVDGCYTMDAREADSVESRFLAASEDGEAFVFSQVEPQAGASFFMKASDLGTYLFYDADGRYLAVEDAASFEGFERKKTLLSDIETLDDDYLPGAQWVVEVSAKDDTRFQLRHLKSGRYLTREGLVEDAASADVITLYPAEGCAEFPELSLDAQGEVRREKFADGSVFGIVDTHSHILSNFGFGGGGIFHGGAFHPLGVEHALGSCEQFHGVDGRQDLFGFGYDKGTDLAPTALIGALANKMLPEFNHHTDGYPTFTDWPSAHDSSTHQTQYYKWLQRAYMGGLRLVVQHATTNSKICELIAGDGIQPIRYSCNDMVAVDRILDETRHMERYIDAQEGGPGQGWFRIVESPEEAREVINSGKMAVVLGIETSNLFDCMLTPYQGHGRCTQAEVLAALDRYYDKGVRAIFPVHKYDNGFSAGDGHRGIIELGNFINSGHHSNFTLDCPDIPAVFDKGDIQFGGLNEPRTNYFAPPPFDMSGFGDAPLATLTPHFAMLAGGPLEGDYCQNAGLSELGEFLMAQLMQRGMIIEVDHLPRRSYQRAYEILAENDYPASGSHGGDNRGQLYELGGVSKMNFSACSEPGNPGGRVSDMERRLGLMADAGAFEAVGFGFDLNGFAGAPGPRFGDASVCATAQQNPITYPFDSYAGGVTFSEPSVGERVIDFNTEGLAHIGMLPELIEDVRRDGASDAQLEPLFKSAEGYLRMWEKSIARGEALAQ